MVVQMKARSFLSVALLLISAGLALSCQQRVAPDCKSRHQNTAYYAHETSCSLYYFCEAGELEIFTCSAGHYFNENLQTCDLAENVACNRCIDDNEVDYKAVCEPTPTCSTSDWGYNKPYPPDCTRYIYCDALGNAVLRYCISGREFSPIVNQCVPAADANCPRCSISTTTVEPPTIAICPETPTCTIEEQGLNKPYPPDCSRYIYCNSEGDAELSNCPPGKHFSIELEYCVTAEEADCPYCEVITTIPIETTTQGTTLEPTTTIAICPETPTCTIEEEGLNKPYPPDCSRYIYCNSDGVAELSNCPPGKHFSIELEYCVTAAEADCPYCEVATAIPTETTTQGTTPEIITTIAICPETPTCTIEEEGFMKPYPPDCTKYLYCNELGEAELSDCRPGFTFSPTEEICSAESDCPYCEVVEVVPTTVVETTTPEATTSTELVTTITICPTTPTCSVAEWGLMKPYPPDCSKYIYCNSVGAAIISNCPINLHYSEALYDCVNPEEANCPYCIEEPVATTTEITTTQEITTTPEVTTTSEITTTPEVTTTPDPTTVTEEISTTFPTTVEEITTTPSNCLEPTCGPFDAGMNKPYPRNCSLYIHCVAENQSEVRRCRTDYEFDPILDRCLPASESTCQNCIPLTTPVTTEEPTTTEGSTTTGEPTPPPCPRTPTCGFLDNGVEKVYPPDCTKYIYCNFAQAEIRTCPLNKHYSPTAHDCLSPEIANCPSCNPVTNYWFFSFLNNLL